MTAITMIHHQVAPFCERQDSDWRVQLWLAAATPPAGVFVRC